VDESFTPLAFAGPRRRSRALVLIGGGLVALVGIGLGALWLLGGVKPERAAATTTQKPAAPAAPAADAGLVTLRAVAQQNIGLEDVTVAAQPIVRTVRATGLVGADETRVVRVRPLSRGRLTETKVELGSKVRAGQVIASYDNIEAGDLSGQLAIAQAGLAQARAEADTTRRSVERARELLAIGGIARADLERRTADHARATAALRTQEAEIARLQDRMRRFGVSSTPSGGVTPILAPIDGIVIRIDGVPGELVDAEREIFTIADLATLWVQADVLEKDLTWIEPGLEARVAVAGHPDRRFVGRVSYVAQMLDPKTNTARVRCTVANTDGALRLNMFATVEIAVPTGHAGIAVPPGAVQYVDQKPAVFVRREAESFELRPVRLGVEDREWVEIAEGLTAGEAVVTAGSLILKAQLLRSRLADD
jgi:cobalt-zinc-cadmium efflux system membrane fusion protein